MDKAKNLLGQRFGRLIVEERGPNTKRGGARWHCICECGNRVLVRANHLVEGNSTTCGCGSRIGNGEVITGDKNPRWNNGCSERKGGYVIVLAKGHPRADKNGYVLKHRLVAENTLGRLLKPKEVVHHIDGDVKNNDPKNLAVMPTHKIHTLWHKRLEEIALYD